MFEGKFAGRDEWFQVDWGLPLSVSHVSLDQGADAAVQSYEDFPRQYEVAVSDSPEDLTSPALASGVGTFPITEIQLPETVGRYVLLRQTTVAMAYWWSIHEIRLDVRYPSAP